MKKTRTMIRLTKPKQLGSLLALALTTAFLLCATPGFGQGAAASPAPAAGVHSKTLWEQIKEGGWVMFPLALCSLGTVTGMIKAFAKLGSSGIGDPSGLSAAIGEVLVATASGLVIAIPAFGAFYFLRNRATDSLHHIQDIVNSLFRKMPYKSLAGV